MKLYHITKQGNLHFELADGRYAAVFPETGYVRVSLEWRVTFKHEKLSSSDQSMAERGAPGNILMYPINKRITETTKRVVTRDLYYPGHNGEMYKYPNPVFYEMTSTKYIRYPNDIVKLMDLLTKFETKNCK
jgi:hypothetical protein